MGMKARNGELLNNDVEQRHAAILRAATRAFAQSGYRNTDVQDIADQAGVGKGTVYRHFGTKEELFLAAVDKGMSELTDTILSRLQPVEDPIERMRVGLHVYFRFFDEHKDLVEIFVQERSEFRGRGKATYFTYHDNNVDVLEGILEDGIKKGLFRDVNVKRASQILADLVYGTVVANLMRDEPDRLVERANDILEIYLKGIGAGESNTS